MDIDTFRGILTGVLLGLFIWLVIWSYSKKRRKDFVAAAQLPLDEDKKEDRHGS
jgi:cytochrome c oxidase cbb3-type subunit 4